MHSSTSALAALAVGLVLLCGLTVGSASAAAGGPATLVDNTTEELADSSETLDGSTADLVNASENHLDSVEPTVNASEELNDSVDQLDESTNEVTNGSHSGTELLDDSNSTGEDDSLDGDVTLDDDIVGTSDSIELPANRTGDSLKSGLDGALTGVESISSIGTRSNESPIAVRLDTAVGQSNSSVAVELGSESATDDGSESADDETESVDDETDRSEAPVPPASGSSDAVDAGLVGLLGGLSILGGVGAGSGASAGASGAGAAGATSSLLGQTVGSVLRLLGGVSGLVSKLPLSLLRYSRYDDSDPLEHETRRAIFDSIEREPGRYLTALESAHDVSLSTIRHHLSVLEDEGLVEARKQGGKRRFYPAQTDGVELAAALDEPAKADILTTLEAVGEAHNGRLADELGLDPSTVSHHVSTLESDGLIERRRDGRTVVNTLAPAVENALDDRAESERTTHRPVALPSDD